jgi:hypothetical protein
MWKANGKTTTLSFFLDGLFPKTEISYMRWTLRAGDQKYDEKGSDIKEIHTAFNKLAPTVKFTLET